MYEYIYIYIEREREERMCVCACVWRERARARERERETWGRQTLEKACHRRLDLTFQHTLVYEASSY